MTTLRRPRQAAGVLVATAACLALPGARALAGVTGAAVESLGGGVTAVTECGSLAAAFVHWQVTGGAVTAVTIGGLPATCAGGALSAALLGAGGDLADGTAVVDASGTATITTLSGAPTATAVAGVSLVVVGP